MPGSSWLRGSGFQAVATATGHEFTRRPAAAFLVFLPDPQGHGSFRPTLAAFRSEPENPENHRPRLSSKHPPMKENMPTTTQMIMPAKNRGE